MKSPSMKFVMRLFGIVHGFMALHEDPAEFRDAAALVIAVGVLPAGWGVFIRCNSYGGG